MNSQCAIQGRKVGHISVSALLRTFHDRSLVSVMFEEGRIMWSGEMKHAKNYPCTVIDESIWNRMREESKGEKEFYV